MHLGYDLVQVELSNQRYLQYLRKGYSQLAVGQGAAELTSS